jgi:polysaccharide pyruvyl transferase WcaK-like protein
MNVLIDSGSYECGNMGDIAMLQVAVHRLRELWPEGRISAITSSPESLEYHCPGVIPVPLIGRDAFFHDHFAGRAHALLPGPLRQRVGMVEVRARRRWPGAVARTIAIKRALGRRSDSTAARIFVDAITRADLLIVSGAGLFTDAFVNGALGVLRTLEFAAERGISTAALGQGIGPVNGVALRERLREVFPLLDFIALREVRESTRLLREVGVSSNRIVVTGDDALELSHAFAASTVGDSIGVNLRVAPYAAVNASVINAIRPALHAAARSLAAPLVPIPIAHHDDCSDGLMIATLVQGYEDVTSAREEISTPAQLMPVIARCRIVVSGSYHSAVFALAQGIPVIGLAQSEYYQWKFAGLADLFPGGCEIVRIDSTTLENDLENAVDRAWRRAPAARESLLAAARRQIDDGRSAYRRLRDIVSDALRARPDGSRSFVRRGEPLHVGAVDGTPQLRIE